MGQWERHSSTRTCHTVTGDLGRGYGALQRHCASEVYHKAGGSTGLTGVGICTFKILGCRRQELAARGHSLSAQQLPDGEGLCCVDEAQALAAAERQDHA